MRQQSTALVLLLITTFISTSTGYAACILSKYCDGYETHIRDDGSKYMGYWKDKKRHGQGTNTWANGGEYLGQYRNDKKHGQGTYTWIEGDKYVGQWEDNKRTGQGTYYSADGDRYEGEFKNGALHGQGTIYYADGKIEVALYEYDVKVMILSTTLSPKASESTSSLTERGTNMQPDKLKYAELKK